MHKVFQILRLKHLNITVFGVCVSLTILFWVLSNLSEHQKAYVPFKISYTNFPEGYVVTNDLHDELYLELEAQGFELLQYELFESNNEIEIDLGKVSFKGQEDRKSGVWLSNQALLFMEQQLKNKSIIKGVNPDTIHFKLEKKFSKKLPLNIKSELKFEEGFRLKDIIANEDSVIVVGPISFFENNKEVLVKLSEIPEFTDSISVEKELDLGIGVLTNPKNILCTVLKENIVRHSINKEVLIINKPEEVSLKLFPHEIEVSFDCGPSEMKLIDKDDFEFIIDYNELNSNGELVRLSVVATKYPKNIKRLKFSPGKLEYIIQKND